MLVLPNLRNDWSNLNKMIFSCFYYFFTVRRLLFKILLLPLGTFELIMYFLINITNFRETLDPAVFEYGEYFVFNNLPPDSATAISDLLMLSIVVSISFVFYRCCFTSFYFFLILILRILISLGHQKGQESNGRMCTRDSLRQIGIGVWEILYVE